jgi:hypothetical protein
VSALDRVREICIALPGTTEKVSHGELAWFVSGRQYANTADRHHDDRVAVWCAAPPGMQESLVASAPERFFRPPYVGVRGWVGIYLDVEIDWPEVIAILREAHALIAERRRPRAR